MDGGLRKLGISLDLEAQYENAKKMAEGAEKEEEEGGVINIYPSHLYLS